MACITYFETPMTMATTQFVRAIKHEDAFVRQMECPEEKTVLRMNWVVVTDSDGNRRLQARWIRSDDC